MKTFSELKKNCKKNTEGMQEYRLAVLGDCATQHLSQAVKGYAYEERIALSVFDADYNQIMAQTMDPGSELYEFKADAVLIDMCTEKLYDAYRETVADAVMKEQGVSSIKTSLKEQSENATLNKQQEQKIDEELLNTRNNFAHNKVKEIARYWDILRDKGLKVLQFNFPEIDDRILGNYGAVNASSFIAQLRKLNVLLSDEASKRGNVYIVDISYIQNSLGRNEFADSKLYFSAKMPYSLTSLPYIGKEVVEIIKALIGKIRKCVVLDLDNTLWGGVIGDDGLNGIQIGELGVGHAFQAFQEWLLELKKTGIILCVCSKNDDDKAKEPFEKHPEMVLRLNDFAMFTANWQDKASNIIEMAKTLNLNTDSFVFVDDNPFERDQVRTMVPGITVPDMPEDPAEYVNFLKSLNLFERITVSSADQDRTRQYQEEAGRKSLENSFASYDEYLSALDMVAKVSAFDEFQTPRIAQLSQRSNQFNLRTVRYTEDDVKKLAESDDYITIYFELKDKFGDHGLISVMVIRKCVCGQDEISKAQETIDATGQLEETNGIRVASYMQPGDRYGFIENWFMSCRVLKRGMEEFIINTLNAKAKEAGLSYVIGEYIKTPKNNMVAEIYKKMDFTEISNNMFIMDVDSYKLRKTYIK